MSTPFVSKWNNWTPPKCTDKTDTRIGTEALATGTTLNVYSDSLGERILICADGAVPNNPDNLVVYSDSEVRLLKASGLTPDQLRHTHSVKKTFNNARLTGGVT